MADAEWNFRRLRPLFERSTNRARRRGKSERRMEAVMGRGLLLWLIGIPLPVILLIWAFGGLH